MTRHIAGPGGPHDRNAAIIDASAAVLLDGVTTAVAHVTRPDGGDDAIALALEGRVNKSPLRSDVLYLMDADGAAKLAGDLIGLAYRNGRGPDFMAAVSTHVGGQL